MPEKHLYEYAVIRLVPKVEREEFLNVGVILYCPRLKFLKATFHLPQDKLQCFAPSADVEDIARHLETFCAITESKPCNSPIATLDAPSRFRWLTAARSTIVQCSKVHPGFTTDPQDTLEKLVKELVL